MPELPEVETMVRGIRSHVEGRKIVHFGKCRCRCRPMAIRPAVSRIQRRVKGIEVLAVKRVAKRIVFSLSSGDCLVFEPRMTGLILLDDPPDRSHLRFEMRFSGRREFNSVWIWDRRGLGTLTLFTAREAEQKLGPTNLGPDALLMTTAQWGECCFRTARPIKVLLLDQKVVGGIGNLYASEILHVATIHPAVPANTLNPRQIKLLSEAVQLVLKEAIKYEGSTLGDGTYRNALNQSGRYQNVHRVYKREGEPCPTCGARSICRIVQAQRSTFYCANCQQNG